MSVSAFVNISTQSKPAALDRNTDRYLALHLMLQLIRRLVFVWTK